MFCRGGKILDSFIPIDKNSGKKRGFAFVRFGSIQEAEKAVELARGRSWGGRKFHTNLVQFQEKKKGRVTGHSDLEGIGNNQFLKGGEHGANMRSAGRIVDEGGEKGVRVASWLIRQQKPYPAVWEGSRGIS